MSLTLLNVSITNKGIIMWNSLARCVTSWAKMTTHEMIFAVDVVTFLLTISSKYWLSCVPRDGIMADHHTISALRHGSKPHAVLYGKAWSSCCLLIIHFVRVSAKNPKGTQYKLIYGSSYCIQYILSAVLRPIFHTISYQITNIIN